MCQLNQQRNMKEDTSGRGDFELLLEEMFTKDYLLVIMNWEKESQKEGEQTEEKRSQHWYEYFACVMTNITNLTGQNIYFWKVALKLQSLWLMYNHKFFIPAEVGSSSMEAVQMGRVGAGGKGREGREREKKERWRNSNNANWFIN